MLSSHVRTTDQGEVRWAFAMPSPTSSVAEMQPPALTPMKGEEATARVQELRRLLKDAMLEKGVAVLQAKSLLHASVEKERRIDGLNQELSGLINTMLRKERQVKVLGLGLEWDQKLIGLEQWTIKQNDARIEELKQEMKDTDCGQREM